ncbi:MULTISPECIES: apolipoprotein N-acyltransferase [unclassified Endozoicomonas]|uniref:apolipoprotein N-acyltransferase n=1 Tax=unclassified Endozoicomonas TaxID=2644528 RepID=UPI002147763A|nr:MULTISPECIES: apolipoprotein N-acyltransferase [unclassified Endozoicomonas]
MNKKTLYFGHFATLLAGSLFPLGFSPFNIWPVLIVATAAGFAYTRTETVKTTTVRGFLFGLGLFGTGTSWVYVSIHRFGAASAPLASLLTALFVMMLAALMVMPLFYLYARLRHRFNIRAPWRQALLFAGLWTLFEWVRSWLLTGFPWLLEGYALLDTPVQSWAPVVGVFGLSLLMATAAALITATLVTDRADRNPPLIALSITLALWFASVPLGKVQWTRPVGEINFSAVQGNIPQLLKWDPGYVEETINTYYGLSKAEWDQELIIWPENAIPLFYSQARSVLNRLNRKAAEHSSALILGLPIDERSEDTPSLFEEKYYNGIIAMGLGEGRYYKQKLVPFGEYVPFDSALRGLISFFDLPMSAFSPGHSKQEKLQVPNAVITTYICYEVVYPDFAAQQAKDSGLLITISNDTWFGKSIGPEQHFQMARMRSLETGRYMIRATNDGISALIDDKGQVVESIERFKPGVLRGTAEVMTGSTPFMLLGSWPVLFLCLLMIAVAGLCARRSGSDSKQ